MIVERFEAAGDEPFSGLSLSVEDVTSGEWRQTWVDSGGSYWSFVGSPQADGSFVFATQGRVDADQVLKRMVFSDIAPDAFDWRWEFSQDGEIWQQRWAIRYTRRSAGRGLAHRPNRLLLTRLDLGWTTARPGCRG